MEVAGNSGAVASGDPKIRGSGVEDDNEGLAGSSDLDVTEELSIHIVDERNGATLEVFNGDGHVSPFGFEVTLSKDDFGNFHVEFNISVVDSVERNGVLSQGTDQ